jgi:glutathione S-transferase
MALELYWGSGSPYAWRVLLALEFKGIAYESHLVQFSKQEHKSPQMLKLNPRGRVPILRDGDYVCFESLAILYYLDRKWPEPPMFGRDPQESGTIMRVICEYQAYAEEQINRIVRAIFFEGIDTRAEEVTRAMHTVAGEARTIEGRLAKSEWLVGESFSAADAVVFPGIQLLLRSLMRREAGELRSRLLPLESNYPAIAAWIARVQGMPGYQRTVPPHWAQTAPTRP